MRVPICVCAFTLAGYVTVSAFVAHAKPTTHARASLRAHAQTSDTRREFVSDVAKLTVTGAGLGSVIAGTAPQAAHAVDADVVDVRFEVQLSPDKKGSVTVAVHPDWAPKGAERFLTLVDQGFFNDVRFFRVLKGFVAQFGISGDPATAAQWKSAKLSDDPVTQSNSRGTLVFATSGPNTRTTQLFINFGDNAFLDKMGFSPFATITEGMDIVDALYSGYGEGAPRGKGPDQNRLQSKGNTYLQADYPNLSYVISAKRN